MRVVDVTGISDCTNLTAQDELDAFDWVCVAATDPVRMVSTGLKEGKHLSDLISFTGAAWKANRLTVYSGGTAFAQTPSTVWWTNPIVTDNDGSDGSDTTAGDVRIVTTNPAATYVIGQDKVALVISPSVTLTGSATTQEDLITAQNRRYIWIEGTLDVNGDDRGVTWNGVSFSVLRNIRAANANNGIWGAGVTLEGSSNNKVRTIAATDTTGYGFIMSGSHYNDVRDVRSARDALLAQIALSDSNYNYLERILAVHSRQLGIRLFSSHFNVLKDVTANNNHSYAIDIEMQSSHNVIIGLNVNQSFSGLRIYSPSVNNVIFNTTAANIWNEGIHLFGVTAGPDMGYPTNNLIANAASVNNGYGVYTFISPDNNHFMNFAAASGDVGINLENTSGWIFSGLLKVGSNSSGDCTVTGGTNPGLVDGTCANNGGSSATLTTGISLAQSFVAAVTTDDTANASDTNGSAVFSGISDWLNFDNPSRVWGRAGTAAFPDASQRHWCGLTGNSENCQIFDWRLVNGDTGDAGGPALQNVLSLPASGNDIDVHTWYVDPAPTAQADCDTAVPGSVFNTDRCETTFLINAVEVVADGIGNDNGLCESDETCIYTPNIGAYQGHGNLVSAGTFTDGTITGVTLVRYEDNGI